MDTSRSVAGMSSPGNQVAIRSPGLSSWDHLAEGTIYTLGLRAPGS